MEINTKPYPKQTRFVAQTCFPDDVRTGLSQGRVYAVLGVSPSCSDGELKARIEQTLVATERAIGSADLQDRDALEGPLESLQRLRSLASDPRWRTEYDFRHGFLRLDERLRDARLGTGPTVEELRRIWRRIHPGRVLRAARLVKRGDRRALDLARTLDPFHPDLVDGVPTDAKTDPIPAAGGKDLGSPGQHESGFDSPTAEDAGPYSDEASEEASYEARLGWDGLSPLSGVIAGGLNFLLDEAASVSVAPERFPPLALDPWTVPTDEDQPVSFTKEDAPAGDTPARVSNDGAGVVRESAVDLLFYGPSNPSKEWTRGSAALDLRFADLPLDEPVDLVGRHVLVGAEPTSMRVAPSANKVTSRADMTSDPSFAPHARGPVQGERLAWDRARHSAEMARLAYEEHKKRGPWRVLFAALLGIAFGFALQHIPLPNDATRGQRAAGASATTITPPTDR